MADQVDGQLHGWVALRGQKSMTGGQMVVGLASLASKEGSKYHK